MPLNKKDYQNIIWDWNGTLLDDAWLCVEIVNTILPNHNDLQLDVDQYKSVFGFPIPDYYERIGIDLKKEPFDELTAKFIPHYEKKVKTCGLQNNTTAILNSIREKQKNQFILTAGHRESVIEMLKHHDIYHFFQDIEGLDNHRAESKIDKGIRWMKNNMIRKESTVLVGDTLHDFEVAEALNVDCILVANGHQSKDRLLSETDGQIIILDSINDLF